MQSAAFTVFFAIALGRLSLGLISDSDPTIVGQPTYGIRVEGISYAIHLQLTTVVFLPSFSTTAGIDSLCG